MFILYCIIYNTILIWLLFASTVGASTVTLTEKVTPERLTTAENVTIPISTTETYFIPDATTTTVEDMRNATAETKSVKTKIENITISLDLDGTIGNMTTTPLSETEEIDKIIAEMIASTSTTEDIKSVDTTTTELISSISETETDFTPNTTTTVEDMETLETSPAETKAINITVENIITPLELNRTTGNMTSTPLSETEEVDKIIAEMITSTTTIEDMTTPSAEIKSVDKSTAKMTSPISETVIDFIPNTTTSSEDMKTSPIKTKAINITIIYVATTPTEKLLKRNKSTITIDDPNIQQNNTSGATTARSPQKLDPTIVLEVVIGTIMLPILVVICIIFYIYWRCLRQGSYTVNEIDESIEEGQEAESLL